MMAFMAPSILVCCGLVAYCGTDGQNAIQLPMGTPQERVLAARNSGDAGAAYASLFQRADRTTMETLARNRQIAISLAAKWELTRAAERPDSMTQLYRFLGYIEGKLDLEIPPRWETRLIYLALEKQPDHLRDVVSRRVKNSSFLRKDGRNVVYVPIEFVESKILAPLVILEGVALEAREKRVVVKQGMHSFSVDRRLLEERASNERNLKQCTMRGAGERAFIVLADAMCSKCVLLCVDSKSGRLVWRNEIWALGTENVSAVLGSVYHDVEIAISDKHVAVCGSGREGCYLEVFDIKIGTNQCRFATNYWFQRESR
jgi:hypothetical protein